MTPFRILFLLFLLIPLLEIYLLIQVGTVIGAMPTVILVVFTAVLGALLLRQQGFATIQRVQRELGQGQIPAVAMLEGVILLFAGALLLTPGFFTDIIGFLCLFPPCRRWAIRLLMRRVVVAGFGDSSAFQTPAGRESSRAENGRTIEGDYLRRDDD